MDEATRKFLKQQADWAQTRAASAAVLAQQRTRDAEQLHRQAEAARVEERGHRAVAAGLVALLATMAVGSAA